MSSALDVLEGLEDDSEEEAEAMTAADVLQKLEEAWLNEKFAPELLETRSDLVECMLEQISQMEENIRRAKKGDFKVSLHSMEIDRIRYILSSYLRCRLQKIEHYTSHILEEADEALKRDDDSCKLSDEELTFAREYAQNMESHLQSLVLRHMPQNLQTLSSKQKGSTPNLDKYVFLCVNESTNGVLVEEETLETGGERQSESQVIAPSLGIIDTMQEDETAFTVSTYFRDVGKYNVKANQELGKEDPEYTLAGFSKFEEIVDLEKGDQHIMRYRPMMSLVNSAAVSLI